MNEKTCSNTLFESPCIFNNYKYHLPLRGHRESGEIDYLKATTGYWYVFRLSLRIGSFLVWWLSMILRTYLQNFSRRNTFKWEIWPKNLKKLLFFCKLGIKSPYTLLKLSYLKNREAELKNFNWQNDATNFCKLFLNF